jgi:hypothetical protein
MRDDITDCLIGNMERDFRPFMAALTESVTLPGILDHGAAPAPGARRA